MGYSPEFTCFSIVDSIFQYFNILALNCLQNLHLAILQTDFIIYIKIHAMAIILSVILTKKRLESLDSRRLIFSNDKICL